MGSGASPLAGEPWADLPGTAKRERLLAAAERVFAEHGLDAPMPAVARAAGAGVGSLYRQFASKEELILALAETHLARIQALLARALEEADAGPALERLLWAVLGESAADDVTARALRLATSTDDSPLHAAREEVRRTLDVLLARAVEQGTIRPDASRRDVVLVVTAARAVREVEPDAWRRMVELALDGLRAG